MPHEGECRLCGWLRCSTVMPLSSDLQPRTGKQGRGIASAGVQLQLLLLCCSICVLLLLSFSSSYWHSFKFLRITSSPPPPVDLVVIAAVATKTAGVQWLQLWLLSLTALLLQMLLWVIRNFLESIHNCFRHHNINLWWWWCCCILVLIRSGIHLLLQMFEFWCFQKRRTRSTVQWRHACLRHRSYNPFSQV